MWREALQSSKYELLDRGMLQFGVVFAGAQKNIGPAGVVLVIVRRDLLGSPLPITPLVFDFTVMTKDNSLHNTPPTFRYPQLFVSVS